MCYALTNLVRDVFLAVTKIDLSPRAFLWFSGRSAYSSKTAPCYFEHNSQDKTKMNL